MKSRCEVTQPTPNLIPLELTKVRTPSCRNECGYETNSATNRPLAMDGRMDDQGLNRRTDDVTLKMETKVPDEIEESVINFDRRAFLPVGRLILTEIKARLLVWVCER